MFGVMDLKTGKCWENNGDIEPYFKKQFLHIDDNNIAVPKDYINWWTSGCKCEHEGCFKDGSVECQVPNTLDYSQNGIDVINAIARMDLVEHLCPEHAYEAGYCTLCGGFWGGIESFDFNNPSQLCENCLDQVKTETCEYDEEEEPYIDA